jgi:DNA-binding CsgD family transcriptional regulator/tetratricopeptide (TPR) repeat protein
VSTRPRIVARDAELARLVSFVTGETPWRALVLTGAPGIGKTTLWQEAMAVAREREVVVLAARPAEQEVQLAFTAVADLLDGVDSTDLATVPAPQVRALEIALFRTDPRDESADPSAVAAGLTGALRVLSGRGPLLVAVDDAPWLDQASAAALAFAARRLRDHPVRFLLTRRSGEPSAVEEAFGADELARVDVGPISLGATRSMLAERLDLQPPRRALLRLFEVAQGNPLVALELGRLLTEHGGLDEELPGLGGDLFAERIAALSEPVRRVLLALALAGSLDRRELAALAGPLVVQDAVAADVLAADGRRVRPAHPLLAAAARNAATVAQRRAVHLGLAATLADETLRVRHRALATDTADDIVARHAAGVAATAIARGATRDAVELAEHALRLTPADSPERPARLLGLARYLDVAGDWEQLRELLQPRLADLPAGPMRARALIMLSDTAERASHMERYLDLALAECGDDLELRAAVLSAKALHMAINQLRGLDQAEAWAREALEAGRSLGAEVERRALHSLAWVNMLRGRPVDALGSRFAPAPQGWSLYESAVERPAAVRAMVRGHLDQARAALERLRALADERGETVSAAVMHIGLCEIELRAGDVRAAERYLNEWHEWTPPDERHSQELAPARCRALLEVVRGRPAEAGRWAGEAIAAARALDLFREETEARRAAGMAALFAGDAAAAIAQLRPLWEHARHERLDEPGAMPVAPHLVAALIEEGEPDEAAAVTGRLAELAEAQDHPWGLATVLRCRALLRYGSGADAELSDAELEQAATAYERLGLRFDAACSLLVLGRAQRRRRKWAAARSALDRAAAIFADLGADGWSEQVTAELSRVGGRRSAAPGELSETELRVARLAAQGRSNKQIASELYVTVHTVEKHLSHVYAKLGVRSRGQLAAALR